jgi:two-component system OmpR family response regulator
MPTALGRVLVVDDEIHVASLLKDCVTHLGYTARVAQTGQEAIQAAAEFHPDAVLLDLTLPDISGETVLGHLHRDDPSLPIVMVTGNPDTEVGRRLLANGAFDYIAKPFDLARLRQVLEAAITHRG